MPIAVMVSGNGSNLQVLIDYVRAELLPVEICCVISNRPDSHALVRAKDANIQCACFDHKLYKEREEFDAMLLEKIRQSRARLVVLAGFMRILTETFVTPLGGQLINLHPSLLPKYPGLDPHSKAIKAGDRIHGATVHFVNQELDAGPIIMQGGIDISKETNSERVRRRVQLEVEHKIVPLTIKWYAEERLVLRDKQVFLDGSPLMPQGYQYKGESL